MKIEEARISMSINSDGTTIELHDRKSMSTFARVTLTPEQLSMILSRLGWVECECEVYGFDKLNKEQKVGTHEFEVPNDIRWSNKELAYNIGLASCPEGWRMDKGFNNQGSFFQKDGKSYARATIRRWE